MARTCKGAIQYGLIAMFYWKPILRLMNRKDNVYRAQNQPATTKEIYIISRLWYMMLRKTHYHKTTIFSFRFSLRPLWPLTSIAALRQPFHLCKQPFPAPAKNRSDPATSQPEIAGKIIFSNRCGANLKLRCCYVHLHFRGCYRKAFTRGYLIM